MLFDAGGVDRFSTIYYESGSNFLLIWCNWGIFLILSPLNQEFPKNPRIQRKHVKQEIQALCLDRGDRMRTYDTEERQQGEKLS